MSKRTEDSQASHEEQEGNNDFLLLRYLQGPQEADRYGTQYEVGRRVDR